MFLLEFSFTIKYRPGVQNGRADALTRLRTEEQNLPQVVAKINRTTEIKPIISAIWSRQELRKLQEDDADIMQIKKNLAIEDETFYCSPDDLLYKRRLEQGRHDPLVAPKCIVPDILQSYHSSLFALHPGQKKTLNLIQQDFYWKSMRKDVKSYIEKCHSCNVHKTNPQLPSEMQKTPVPGSPWSRISLDIVGPLNRTQHGNKYLLTCVDSLTRYPECVPLADIKADTVARAFVENIILRYGTPRELLTDCGTQFVGKLFVEICKILQIRKLKTTPYHPAANGIVERMHKTLKTMISHFVDDYHDSWDEILPFALMAYRNSIHQATNDTPFFLMFGRDMETALNLTIREDKTR